MKLLLENWRKYLKAGGYENPDLGIPPMSYRAEDNKKTGTLLYGPVDLHTSHLYRSADPTPAGVMGQEVEIISRWQDQGTEYILIRVEVFDDDPNVMGLVEIEGWVEAEAVDEGSITEEDALDENEEYCPACVETMDEAKKKACKPSKGKRFAKRVDGKCRSYGQAGQAKGGGDRIRPGTKKGDAYCARSAGIKKCKNPPCANTLSRKKWKCRGKKSMKSQ
tara:strand:+ start:13 stop:675 length:663 start_codon:yes stop_codon:yes gene_type:complete